MTALLQDDQELLDKFILFFADCWDNEFEHSYAVSNPSHKVWESWKASVNQDEAIWLCKNLNSAFKAYSWQGEYPYQTMVDLRAAISEQDDTTAAKLCQDIFDWGGVAKIKKASLKQDASVAWLHENLKSRTLSQKIQMGVNLLKDESSDLACFFDGKTALMNSAMTKLFWAADPGNQIIIYDGRVGAALGLIARRFLEKENITFLPSSLKYRWGSSRDKFIAGQRNKRNPSTDMYKFPSLFVARQKDFQHALMVRKSTCLITSVVNQIAKIDKQVTAQSIEKALFMIGYDVSGN